MSDEYGWIFLGSEENMLDYPFGLFQVTFILLHSGVSP